MRPLEVVHQTPSSVADDIHFVDSDRHQDVVEIVLEKVDAWLITESYALRTIRNAVFGHDDLTIIWILVLYPTENGSQIVVYRQSVTLKLE